MNGLPLTLKPLRVLPILVCRRQQTEDVALGKRVEELKKNLLVEAQVLKKIVVNDETDTAVLTDYVTDADAVLLYKPHLGLGNCVIKIAEFGLPIILFNEEYQVRNPLDALEYIYPRKNVWVAIDYQSVNLRLKLLAARKKMRNTKILVLNSDYPHWENFLRRIPGGLDAIRQKLGMEVEYIKSTEVIRKWKDIEKRRAERVAEEWVKDAEKVIEPKEDDVIAVARLYLAIKDFLEERGAQAMTMAYGDDPLPVPCFAYTNLRDEGVPAACEADIISLLSMIILHHLTDKPSFMGNIFTETDDGIITLSHCVAPRKMRGYDASPHPYVLRDQHWGQFLGSLSAFIGMDIGQEVTLCRLSGDLHNMLVTRGSIVACRDLEGYCRVTVKIRIDASARKFIGKTSGNHHLMVYGDYREQLSEFNELLDIVTEVGSGLQNSL